MTRAGNATPRCRERNLNCQCNAPALKSNHVKAVKALNFGAVLNAAFMAFRSSCDVKG
jgi:hypothetical protein